MRILHVSTRLILGGSQENTVLSCEGQTRLGHDVHLAFGPIYGPEGSLLARVERSASTPHPITTHLVPDLVREVSPLRDAGALRHLRRLVRALRPDIVHTHSSKAGILGRAAAWRPAGAGSGPLGGVVHTIHGPPFMPVEGPLTARMRTALLNRVYAHAERAAARRCHLIVSVADAMSREFLRRGIGRPEQYVTVRSGIDTAPYLSAEPGASRGEARARLGLAPDDFVIGTVARLAEHKGHDDLLDALGAHLRARPAWKLLWVGDGWRRARLLARVRALGLDERVVVTGLVPPEDIPAHLRAMDVLAHPSYREGLPRTVPQALLAGVCPVAYDADGTREACIDGQTGLLVPVGDRAALGRAVVRLFEDPPLRARLADQGRDLVLREFSAQRMVEHLEEVYRRARALAG